MHDKDTEDIDIYQDSDDDDTGVSITTLDGNELPQDMSFPVTHADPSILSSVANKSKKVKSGGFQSMGLIPEVLRAVMKLGYSVPTPIQRKAIPIALAGNDLVAMARTGSGKTAAFLLPMIQHLRSHSTRVGARAVILAPTRELAEQTYKAAKLLCKLTDIRLCLLVGGETFENQFGLLAQNPDLIVATPGRLMHHMAEVGMTLRSVEMLVFDEADRLFEMGFSNQLSEIMKSMSDKRQTLLFSATLPSALAEFARAGLHNPILIRLDVESKLSENLKMSFLACRLYDKPALVVHLLKDIIPPHQQTVVFVATKHHVEFMHALLRFTGIDSTMIYGSMDQSARKINIAKFRANKTRVLIVTDVAARGIDLPLLDNVINCDFPFKPKLFVHRVGRVARAGRHGQAYSLVSSDEVSYMVDLHLFLGRDILMHNRSEDTEPSLDLPYYGSIPQDMLDTESEWVKSQLALSVELQGLERTMNNAFKLYYRTRLPPSAESVRRAKKLPEPPVHPMLLTRIDEGKQGYLDYLKALKTFRPTQTVFEAKMNTQGGTTVAAEVMGKKRAFHSSIIAKEASTKKRATMQATQSNTAVNTTSSVNDPEDSHMEEEVQHVPQANKKRTLSAPSLTPKKKKKVANFVDEEFFLSNFQSSNTFAEKGYSVKEQQGITSDAIFDVAPDEASEEYKRKKIFKWDKKDMKYKKHSVENRIKIDKKFYQQWTKSTHARIQKEGEQEVPFRFNNAQQQLGLEDTVAEVNQEVRQKYKNKQIKPSYKIKSEKIKKWKDQNQQAAKRQTRVHARQQKIKKGGVSFKAQHKHKGSNKK